VLFRQLAIVTLRNFCRKLVGEQAELGLLLHLQMLVIVVVEALVHSWVERLVHNWLFARGDVRLSIRLLRLLLVLWVQLIKLHLGLMLLKLLRMEVLSRSDVHLLSCRV
jgi:hypothetical protein